MSRWQERKRHRALNRIRGHFAAFGFPLGMTDEELEAGLLRIGEAAAKSGVSMATATENMNRIFGRGGILDQAKTPTDQAI